MQLSSYQDKAVIIKEKDHSLHIQELQEQLTLALKEVGLAAHQVSSNADFLTVGTGDYIVDVADMDHLRQTLKKWEKASANLLEVLE